MDSRERLKAFRFENLEIRRAAEESKRGQAIERSNEPQDRKNEAEKRSDQREAGIDRLKNHIKRAEQNDRADAISNEADERETKLRFVRENIARCVDGIARNDERAEQEVIAEDDEDEREQTGNACDFRGRAL